MEPPVLALPSQYARRNRVTITLLFIAGLVLILQLPLEMIHSLQRERSANRAQGYGAAVASPGGRAQPPAALPSAAVGDEVFDTYRMVERALKHGALVLALVFAAYFLFEILADLRLHAVHYGLVGAALCLFYLALLALGEVLPPAVAYVVAAVASSLLVVLYSGAILRSWARAGLVAALLGTVYSVLFVVLRMEHYALLAGTATLFLALAAIMYFTRGIDWSARETGAAAAK